MNIVLSFIRRFGSVFTKGSHRTVVPLSISILAAGVAIWATSGSPLGVAVEAPKDSAAAVALAPVAGVTALPSDEPIDPVVQRIK